MLLLLALVSLAPIVASYVTYYWFVPDKRVNYGELLPGGSAPPVIGVGADGVPFALSDLRGQWVPDRDHADCTDVPWALRSRQARTIQGREKDRVVRGWLRPTERLRRRPNCGIRGRLVIASAGQANLARLPLDPGGAPDDSPAGPAQQSRLRYGANPTSRLAADLAPAPASQMG
jgi:hypothetical protein